MKQNVISFALVILGLFVIGLVGKSTFENRFGLNKLPVANYVSTVAGRSVVKGVDGLANVTRVKLTPDEWMMFATTLDGRVWVLKNLDGKGTDNNGRYVLQTDPVYQVELGWKPGMENGMTGLAISYDFAIDHTVFVSYAKNVSGEGRNYIDRLVLQDDGKKVTLVNANNIFIGNTPSGISHQIQGMVTLPIQDKLHVMFVVGEGREHPEWAQDLTKEAGKVLTIQADGSNPLGDRPWPQYPRVQAIGLRNAYDLVRNEATNWVYLTDNGPDSNDCILYAPIMDATNQVDFGWDGTGESLLKPKINGKVTPELVIYHWDKTVSPSGIAMDSLGRFYFDIFSSATYPHKEVWMGEVGDNQQLKLTKIAERRAGVDGGNLLGLAISDLTGNIWFSDFSDGAIYALGRSWELTRVIGK